MVFAKLKNLWGYISGMENWADVFAEWFGISRPDYRLYRFRNGLRFVGRPKKIDRGPMFDIILNHEYDRYHVSPKDIVVDIGAHVGTYSVLAGKNGASVLAIEPDPESFRLLRINLLLNNVAGVAENIALLNKTGHATLKSSNEQSSANSLILKEAGLSYADIEVPTDTLENVLKRNGIGHVDILKMDCEGAEYSILGSVSEKTAASIDRMIIEYHYIDAERNGPKLAQRIKSLGFSIDYCGTARMGLIMARNVRAS